jgi:hypothetical protein
VVIDVSAGQVASGSAPPRPARAGPPADLVLAGQPRLILGVLSAFLSPAQATDLGLLITGDPTILRRLQPVGEHPFRVLDITGAGALLTKG